MEIAWYTSRDAESGNVRNMQLMVAQHTGFCYGVRRAVDMAERAAATKSPCYTLGEIIHNPQMVQQLRARGVMPAASVDEVPNGALVVVRAHGVSMNVLEALREKGCEVWDATCPDVVRIHAMVLEAARSGTPVMVCGAADHPEVQGTLGWACGLGRAIETAAQANEIEPMERALIVAQTTIGEAQYDEMVSALRSRIREPDVKRTLCPATRKRQQAALDVARQVDIMIVVGGRNSSNTQKLFELCKAECPRTHFIETAAELDAIQFGLRDRIGITLGASTPDCTFKEVVARMNDNENKDLITPVEEAAEADKSQAAAEPQEIQEPKESSSDADFMADIDRTMVQIRPGQTITGTVVQITDDEVCVNVGYKADGLIKKADLTSVDCKIGDEIEVEVVKVNDGEGNVLLSQRNIVNRKFWDEIVEKYENDQYVDGVGKEAVKGGLIATVNGIRTFIPASQLSQRYVEKIEEFVGQPMKLKIIEIDKPKKRIVASRKVVLQAEEAEKKKTVWGTLNAGDVVKGTVRRLTDFGAFVDIGGVDGLVHVTDRSWGRVKHPSDVVSVNQQIDVKILNVDPDKERISLSYKQTQPRPWDVAMDKYPVGAIVQGKVVRITTFGAFVELEPGLDGLVHISQCALTRINKVEDAVQVGQDVRVKVLDVNPEARRISLSIRAVLEDEAFENMPATTDEYAIDGGNDEYAIYGQASASDGLTPSETKIAEAFAQDAPVSVHPETAAVSASDETIAEAGVKPLEPKKTKEEIITEVFESDMPVQHHVEHKTHESVSEEIIKEAHVRKVHHEASEAEAAAAAFEEGGVVAHHAPVNEETVSGEIIEEAKQDQ